MDPLTSPLRGGPGHGPDGHGTAPVGKPPIIPAVPRGTRPIRKDEIVIEERGLYIESWLPDRRSRRRPLLFIHGELGGSWLWERFLGYFAGRGWEAHALNLRGHFWSDTVDDMAELDFDWYLDDVAACYDALARPAVVVGHGLGALLALKLGERRELPGLCLIAPALPAQLRSPLQPHELRAVPPIFRRDHFGWARLPAALQRDNPDLALDDVLRVQHMMGAESAQARQAALEGVPLERDAIASVPMLVVGGGLDRLFPAADAERMADWLGADYEPFGAHSHYGLVIGEQTYGQVADALRTFLEEHKL